MPHKSDTSIKKVALITGASSGIGAATAIRFAKLGYRMVLSAKNVPVDEEELDEIKAKCLEANKHLNSSDIVTMIGDLTEEAHCQDLINKTIDTFQRLDLLVANAGLLSADSLENLEMDDFDRVMNLNCRSVVVINQLAIPHLAKTKGNIVNVSSTAGLRASADMLAYCLSKAAVIQLTRCAAMELGPKGIRVNAVCPGVIDHTRIFSNAGLQDEMLDMAMELVRNVNPLRRTGNPDEVAQSIVFLASEERASFITGMSMSIDGGRCVNEIL